ncbi:hypothetical protein GGS26DRAFT_588491 [Hypomontagnella submonticulosa]|nr:hypothetical protein GGS26DRAFT_588491 [Hypomontagnella submonticulosa]
MPSNEASQPAAEARNEHEMSSVSKPASISRENVPAPATRDQPEGSVNGTAPTMPTRPTGSPIAQPTSARRQQPLPQPYPQQQLPYVPYPYPPQPYPYAQPIRVLPPYSKSWTVSKLVLTIASIVIAIVILALSSAFLSEEGAASFTGAYALPITIAAILWNGAELITFGVRARKDINRGIHPGAHVGLHLCFWLACVFAVLITTSITLVVQSVVRNCLEYDNDDNDFYSGTRYCNYYDDESSLYSNGSYLPMIQTMLAFFCLATIVHFILFVMACIETHKRNVLKPAGIVMPAPGTAGMYYAPPPPPGVAPYYPYPAPMAPRQAHVPPQPNVPGAAVPRAGQQNEAARNYKTLAGFYAPSNAPASAPISRQASRSPIQAATTSNNDNEKAGPSTSASPGQAL